MKSFSEFKLGTFEVAVLDRKFPSYLKSWDETAVRQNILVLNSADTHYGYVHGTITFLKHKHQIYRLQQGMYFCVPGYAEVWGGSGIVVSRENFQGMFTIGGPVEHRGRLRYIDGCTDSLLIPPIILGDPCLNLLYFPPGIDQTEHTHPSDRIGMIMSGRGQCHYREHPDDQVTITELYPGMVFCIHTDGRHKFTTPFGEEMRVLAYHPDSDFGPTHEFHPMLNRTIVGGVSANQLPEIQTKTGEERGDQQGLGI